MNKLSHKNMQDSMVYAEQVQLLYKPFMLSAIATFAASIWFGAIQWSVIDHNIIISWLFVVAVITLLRGALMVAYRRAKPDAAESQRWGTLFIVGAAVAGVAWGLGGVLLFPDNNPERQMIVALVMIVMSAGAVTSLGVERRALLVFIIPVMFPLLPLFLMEGGYVAVFVIPMVMLTFFFFVRGAGNVCVTTQQNIRMRIDAVTREEMLIQAKKMAEESSQAKSDFLSRMSHELRTPMNAIIGFSQLMMMDAERPLSDMQKDNANEIVVAGKHLLYLINEVLDLAAIESGKFQVSMESVCLKDIVDPCLKLIQQDADRNKIKIIDHVSKCNYIVQADFTRLKQVLLNLLSNAVKYNCYQGAITVTCEQVDDKRLRIAVADTGNGLTNEEIDLLFVPFERMGEKENIEGTGIGLVITKQLVELMNGRLGVESVVGEGSVFWLELNLEEEPSGF